MKGHKDFKKASSLKKGDDVIVDDEPCIVKKVNISSPGKHGHAKVNFMAEGMFDDKTRNEVAPGDESVEVPIVDKRNAQVLNVDGDKVNIMDMENYETYDLDIPEEFEGEIESGDQVIYWLVLEYKVIKELNKE